MCQVLPSLWVIKKCLRSVCAANGLRLLNNQSVYFNIAVSVALLQVEEGQSVVDMWWESPFDVEVEVARVSQAAFNLV